jgi:hypothetical protein
MAQECYIKRGVTSVVVTLVFGAVVAMGDGSMTKGADVSHELGKIKVEQLKEISDLAASRRNPDVLWLHNDGDSGQLFAVSTSGKLVALVDCRAAIKDLEDIAIGPGPEKGVDYLYLGDIGDNSEKRREIRVARFAEPDLSGGRGQQLEVNDAEEFRLNYPDGPHDAEAMFVDPVTGELCIVTKEKKRARLYTAAGVQLRDQTVTMLTAAGEMDVEEVSAGAISPDGRHVLLRREGQGWLWKRAAGESVADAMARKPKKVPVLGKQQGPNGESITFTAASDGYFTVSEGKKQAIYQFDLPSVSDESER